MPRRLGSPALANGTDRGCDTRLGYSECALTSFAAGALDDFYTCRFPGTGTRGLTVAFGLRSPFP